MTQFRSHLNGILGGTSKIEIIEMFSGRGFELHRLGYIEVKDIGSSSNHPITISSEHLDHLGDGSDDFMDESDYIPLKEGSPLGKHSLCFPQVSGSVPTIILPHLVGINKPLLFFFPFFR